MASSTGRSDVDLRDYGETIKEAVRKYMPNAQVEVCERYYTVDPTPDRGNAIRIGRALSDVNVLGKYCVKIPKLFCSEETGKEVDHGREEKRTGGHQ